MTLANLTFQQEQRMMTTRVLTWMSKHYQEDRYQTNGAIDADALADDAAWNFGILRDWALELAEGFKAGKEVR